MTDKTKTGVKLPLDITLPMVDHDGNAFAIIGRARKVMKLLGYSDEIIKEFRDEAISGDYDKVLQTCMRWFRVT